MSENGFETLLKSLFELAPEFILLNFLKIQIKIDVLTVFVGQTRLEVSNRFQE